MEDAEADSVANDIKVLAEALVSALGQQKYDDVAEYVTKMKQKLEDLSIYAERKKVAF